MSSVDTRTNQSTLAGDNVNQPKHQLPQTTTTTTVVVDEPDKLYKKLEIELKGIDPAVLKSYSWFATNAAQNLNIEVGKW